MMHASIKATTFFIVITFQKNKSQPANAGLSVAAPRSSLHGSNSHATVVACPTLTEQRLIFLKAEMQFKGAKSRKVVFGPEPFLPISLIVNLAIPTDSFPGRLSTPKPEKYAKNTG